MKSKEVLKSINYLKNKVTLYTKIASLKIAYTSRNFTETLACVLDRRDMSIFDYSLRKWPENLTQKLFLSTGKIVYYQDVPQLTVPLNTLHTVHLNAKSHDLL